MALFVLVMMQYDGDSTEWLYSASALTRETLESLTCYQDPPNSLPRADFAAVNSWKLSHVLRPCDRPGALPIEGTVYQLESNA